MALRVTVQQALQRVADNPEQTLDPIDTPVHELVARILYEIANNPDADTRGSFTRANRARKMIFDRLAGTRKTGTTPAKNKKAEVAFVDLTGRTLGQSKENQDG